MALALAGCGSLDQRSDFLRFFRQGESLPAMPVVEVTVYPQSDTSAGVLSTPLAADLNMHRAFAAGASSTERLVEDTVSSAAKLASANAMALDALLRKPPKQAVPGPATAADYSYQAAMTPVVPDAIRTAVEAHLRRTVAAAEEQIAAVTRALDAPAAREGTRADRRWLMLHHVGLRLDDERRRALRFLRGLERPDHLSGWAWREDVELWFVDRTAARRQPDPWWRAYLLIPDPILAGGAGERAIRAVADAFGVVRSETERTTAKSVAPFAAVVVAVRPSAPDGDTALGPSSPLFLAERYDALFARGLLARLQREGRETVSREGGGLDGVYLVLTAGDLMVALASEPAVPLPRTEFIELTALDTQQMRCAFYLLRRDLLAAASAPRQPTIDVMHPTRLERVAPGPLHAVADAIGEAFETLFGTDRAEASESDGARFVEPEVRKLCEQAGLQFAQAR